MLSVNRPRFFHQLKVEMQDNGSPEQVNDDQQTGKRKSGSGKDSPHSTTGTPPSSSSSRQRAATRCADRQNDENGQQQQQQPDETGKERRPTQALKDVLSAAVQLSGTMSRHHSEACLQIVTDLLIGSIDSTQFQQRLAQVIDVPLRPIVPPLLDKQLPYLRREMASRLHPVRPTSTGPAQQLQTTANHVKEHVKTLLSLDQESSETGKLGVWQVFQPVSAGREETKTRKRRASTSLVESKRMMSVDDEAGRASGCYSTYWMPPKVNSQAQTLDVGAETSSSSSTTTKSYSSFPPQGDEEWANIHTMLNCILSMVEKTRRALGILQQRAVDNQQQKRREFSTLSLHQHQAYEASELRRQAGELIAQTLKATEDRVSQVKRKAEEAVHDVRRAAMAELQRALSAERLRAERLAAEARRQGAEEALSALGQHAMGPGSHHQGNKEVCWNCGRRANETCSGCNVARYCSTFCQHKHWEVHHKICGRVSQLMLAAAAAAASATAGTPPSSGSDHRTELGGRVGSPSSSHLSAGHRNSSSKTPSPVQQPTSGSYVH